MKSKLFLITPMVLSSLASCNNGVKKEYKITWVNYDGKVLQEQTIKEGETPVYSGKEPSREKIKGTSYVFNGWDNEITPVHMDKTYTAVFKNIKNFTVKWFDNESKLLKEDEMVDEGSIPTYTGKITPKKPHEGDTYYYFDKWDKDLTPLTEDRDYYPTFKETTSYSDKDHDGLLDYIDPTPLNNVYKVTSTQYDINIDTQFKIDYSSLDSDNTSFNKELAKFGAALNIDFSGGQINFNDEIGTRSNRKTIYLNRLGCDNVIDVDLSNYSYSNDKKDLTGYILAHHREQVSQGVYKDYIFITVQPTSGNNEWASNFDFGANVDDYFKKNYGSSYTKDNAPTDWDEDDDHRNYHKGFYVAANRAYTNSNPNIGIKAYINKIMSDFTNTNYSIFVSGHSRGAGIANIIAKWIHDDADLNSKCKVFAYTYASPNVYIGNTSGDNYIYNILNDDDIVPRLPLAGWNAKRFGVDIHASVYHDSNLYYEYNKRTNREYSCITELDDIVNKLTLITGTDRNKLYTIDETEPVYKGSFTTSELRDASLDYYKTIINELGIDKQGCDSCFKFKTYESSNKYYLEIYNCVGAVSMLATSYLTGSCVISDINAIKTLFNNYLTIILSIATDILLSGTTIIEEPHTMIPYFFISDKQ